MKETICTLPTGHRLQATASSMLGTRLVQIVSDIAAGDEGERINITVAEMDALCKWWLAKSEAVLVPKDIANAAAGTVALLGDEMICKFGRPSPAAREALRNLAAALGWKEAGTNG